MTKKTSKKATKKTTAADERAARERRAQARKAPKQPSAVLQEMAAEAAAVAAPAEPTAAGAAVELGEGEYFEPPTDLPEGAKVKKITTRNGQKLAQPIYKVTLRAAGPAKPSEVLSKKSKRQQAALGVQKVQPPKSGKWYCGDVNSARAQAVFKQISKATAAKPIKNSDLEGQYPKRLARMLAANDLVVMERREDVGVVFYGK